MKKTLIILLLIYIVQVSFCQTCSPVNCDADCPEGHQPPLGSSSSPLTVVSLTPGIPTNNGFTEEDLCSSGPWLQVFDEEFNGVNPDGTGIDQAVWNLGWSNDQGDLNESTAMNSSNLYVSNGILHLVTTFDNTTKRFICPSICTKRQFPAGRIEILAAIPNLPTDRNIDEAPLWLRTYNDLYNYTNANTTNAANKVDFVNEMDIEFMENSLSYGTYTLHSTNAGNPPYGVVYSDAEVLSCNNGGSYTDGCFHTFDIYWDMYNVDWVIDGQLVDHLSQYYKPDPDCAAVTVNNCDNIPVGDLYWLNQQFPLFANETILLSGLGSVNSSANGASESPIDPIDVQIDYVKFWRKITCDKDLQLNEYRTAGGTGCDGSGGDQVPPTVTNQTPSVITGGTITAGSPDGSGDPYIFRRNDYLWGTQQNLDLYATQDIVLLPGFETDLLYQANGPCSLPPYGPHINSGETFGNNWTIQDVFTAQIASCPPTDGVRVPKVAHPSGKSMPAITNYSLSLYPNPSTTGQCTVQFSMPVDADVTITLVDITGREVATLDHSWHSIGTSYVPFSTESYAPGVYTVRFSDGINTSTQRLTITGK